MKKRSERTASVQRLTLTCGLVAVAVLATACSGDAKEKPATQTAAKVNKEEITVHQINAVLAQQRGARSDQADAGRAVLERLIDQELSVQKAAELKIDRDPRVVQRLQAARREIIASAYREKLAENAVKPTAAEVKAYYNDHPALFGQRKVYQLQELSIRADADQTAALRTKVAAVKNLDELVAHLKASGFRYASNQAVRAAEQVPLSLLPQLSQMKDGGLMFNAAPQGATVLHLAASRPQPVDLERATPAIEQFLVNQRKQKIVADDLKALRATSKIEYAGPYAAAAPQATALKEPSAADVAASAAASLDAKSINEALGLKASGKPAGAIEAAESPATPSSGVDASTISRGLGLK